MKIKICGLTHPDEAVVLNRYQVDFAGMVLFVPRSKRCITIEKAMEIKKKLDASIKTVAVVVAPTIEQALQIQRSGFDYIQIHGEIPEGFFEEIQIPVIKAFNIKDLEEYEWYQQYSGICGYVFDAQEPGSGKTFDWNLLAELKRDGKWFFLAGGLNGENVKRAIKSLEIDGVDVSSGVEYEDRLGKDERKIKQFVEAVRGE